MIPINKKERKQRRNKIYYNKNRCDECGCRMYILRLYSVICPFCKKDLSIKFMKEILETIQNKETVI